MIIVVIRGWTDDEGNEYVIAGCSDGTSFIDVSSPSNPIVIGFLPTNTEPSIWRDIKVFKGYAYIGSEALNHGIQIFDLSQLTHESRKYREMMSRVRMMKRDIATQGHVKLGLTFKASAVYTEFGNYYFYYYYYIIINIIIYHSLSYHIISHHSIY